ncbi:MAG: sigma-54 dependent transcriptional regulator [Planctomycetes bacterium]|nr:sigma-54 dependent transcriptional regulator [Planctomycetota bacterium]
MKILLVEDDLVSLELLRGILKGLGHDCAEARDGAQAWRRFQEAEFDAVLSDWRMPGMDGLELCRLVRSHPKETYTYFILVTASGGRENLEKGIEAGVDDFLEKPFEPGVLRVRLTVASRISSLHRRTALAEERASFLEEQARSRTSFQGLVGKSPAMQEVFRRIRLAAQGEARVLISGESGTGKELAARAIQALSPRKEGPFLAINCGAIPDPLLESELFGHAKGSFTGATRDKAGLLEAADGGSLFLDEIGDVSAGMQLKLLRFLEDGEVRRVGEHDSRRSDVRVVSATNRDLGALVASGAIRQDFFYRIRVFEIALPPVRARKEDIPLLARHFLEALAGGPGGSAKRLSPEALHGMLDHPWPGNVRELRNAIEHALVVQEGPTIRLEDLPVEIRRPGGPDWILPARSAKAPAGRLEPGRIQEALKEAGGNRNLAARKLGVSRVTLWKWLKRYRLGT